MTAEMEMKDIKNKFEYLNNLINIFDNLPTDYNVERKSKLAEMCLFFSKITKSYFEKKQNVVYKSRNAYDFFRNSLNDLCATLATKGVASDTIYMFDELYKCFDLLFPESVFKDYRTICKSLAEKTKFFKDKNNNTNSLGSLVDALAINENGNDQKELDDLSNVIADKHEQLNLLVEELEYISKRAKEVKTEIEAASKDTINGLERAEKKLETKNSELLSELQKKIDSNIISLEFSISRQEKTTSDLDSKLVDLRTRLDALNLGVYREELASYFLKEHDKLKGIINPFPLISMAVLALMLTEIFEKMYFYYLRQDTTVMMRIECYLCVFFGFPIVLQFLKSGNDDNDIIKNIKSFLTPYWCWLAATLCGMGAILYMALRVCYRFECEPVSYSSLLPYASIYIILAWFTWFAAKQFSYTKQICDEYEYKYALAKSYISYRDEAKNLIKNHDSNPLLVTLLDAVIKNIANSPVQSVRQDVHTPFSEVFKAVKETVNHGNEDK